jgi:hypothetical protein
MLTVSETHPYEMDLEVKISSYELQDQDSAI